MNSRSFCIQSAKSDKRIRFPNEHKNTITISPPYMFTCCVYTACLSCPVIGRMEINGRRRLGVDVLVYTNEDFIGNLTNFYTTRVKQSLHKFFNNGVFVKCIVGISLSYLYNLFFMLFGNSS